MQPKNKKRKIDSSILPKYIKDFILDIYFAKLKNIENSCDNLKQKLLTIFEGKKKRDYLNNIINEGSTIFITKISCLEQFDPIYFIKKYDGEIYKPPKSLSSFIRKRCIKCYMKPLSEFRKDFKYYYQFDCPRFVIAGGHDRSKYLYKLELPINMSLFKIQREVKNIIPCIYELIYNYVWYKAGLKVFLTHTLTKNKRNKYYCMCNPKLFEPLLIPIILEYI